MKLRFFALCLAVLIPVLGSAIELEAERECRDRLWNDRVGSLVSLDVAHPLVGRSTMTGILDQVDNEQLDFSAFLVNANRVIESSVVLPKKGDLIIMNVWEDGHSSSLATIFNRVERGLLYGADVSVPVAHLTGGVHVVKPETYLYLEYYRLGSGSPESLKTSGFYTFKRVDETTLTFDGLSLPLSHVTRLQIARP